MAYPECAPRCVPDQEPTLVVPAIERPDAEAAEGVRALTVVDWRDGSVPYEAARALTPPACTYGISDAAWALHWRGTGSSLHFGDDAAPIWGNVLTTAVVLPTAAAARSLRCWRMRRSTCPPI